MPLQLTYDALSDERFGSSPPFHVGVEEELLLVDPVTCRPTFRTDDVLAHERRLLSGEIVEELCDGVIELVTPVCSDAHAAACHLSELRHRASVAGGPVLMGAGVHPDQPFGMVRHRGGEHFEALVADLRGVAAQSAFCGVHVHVGMPDAEAAIAACNGIRRWIPLLSPARRSQNSSSLASSVRDGPSCPFG